MENLIVHSLLCLFNLKASGKMKNKKVKMILTFFFFVQQLLYTPFQIRLLEASVFFFFLMDEP